MSIPFYKVDVGGDEREKIDEVFDGEAPDIIQDLESAFEAYIGATYALATSHGTSALHLAMLPPHNPHADWLIAQRDRKSVV